MARGIGSEPASMSASLMRQPLVLALLCLPSGCLVGVLLIYPLVNGIWLGFTDASPLNRSLHFVGLANFIDLLTDPKFWEVLWNSAFLIVTSIVLSTLLGFVVALMLTSGIRWVGLPPLPGTLTRREDRSAQLGRGPEKP
jgi:ABC-type sugar transport system permease subunit